MEVEKICSIFKHKLWIYRFHMLLLNRMVALIKFVLYSVFTIFLGIVRVLQTG